MPGDQTSIGGEGRQFPATRWSAIQQAADPAAPGHREALAELCRRYWKPIYAYIRAARGRASEDAKDLTQAFVVELLEGGLLGRYAPDGGSFRAYLKGALRRFLAESHRHATAARRGGGRPLLPIDEGALGVGGGPESPEQAFERLWVAALIDQATDDLQAELTRAGKTDQWEAFRRYELAPDPAAPLTHAALADALGLTRAEVNNALSRCRRRLRALIVRRIRGYASDEREVALELARVFCG